MAGLLCAAVREQASPLALYELEEVGGLGLLGGADAVALPALALLSASYRPLQTVPVRGPTGVEWGYTGGAEIPLI